MELQELLTYFSESDTIGENREAVELMRVFTRGAEDHDGDQHKVS